MLERGQVPVLALALGTCIRGRRLEELVGVWMGRM